MPFTTTKEMLSKADAGRYAIGAFNVENMEMIMAAVAAAEEERSPIILQTTPSTLKYADLAYFHANVKVAAERVSVPVALHVDHGNSFELAMRALRVGYTSIMIDGSTLPLEQNIALSRRVVDACRANDIPVEAELGTVGGKEDDMENSGGYTDPDVAAQFVEQTGVDTLAVAIGTAHGIYKGTPRLDLHLLKKIDGLVSIPLVLHGTSGVDNDVVRECISLGICKVNYATDLRIAYTAGVRAVLDEDQKVFDPKKYNGSGMDHLKETVKERIRVCGSNGKA